MSELTGKELAIKVAEKLGDDPTVNALSGYTTIYADSWIQGYCHAKAADIIFSEGMAGRMCNYLRAKKLNDDSLPPMDWFWRGVETNGTLTPEKILNVWLDIDKG